MTAEAHLDGNAAGAMLADLFGREMTDRRGCCDGCGSINLLGALLLYEGAGDVLRCASCGTVVLVAVPSPGGARISFSALRWVEVGKHAPSGGGTSR